jgi:hypothetical protein
MSWLTAKNQSPGGASNKYLDQIPGQVQPHYDPYINAGRDSLETLKNHYGQMTENPGEYLNNLGKGYTQSPGYAATLRQAMAGANNAAALGRGGSIGSYGHQQLSATAAGDVANKDYEQYLNHVLGLNTQGLAGEQGLENQGFEGDKDMANLRAQILAQQGQNAFGETTARNQNNGQHWSDIFSTLGRIGGGIAGGPIGAAAGNAAASWLFPGQGG